MQCESRRGQTVGLLAVLLVVFAIGTPVVLAQRAETPPQTAAATAVIQATVTTQGTIPLGGVLVTLQINSAEVAALATDGDGNVRFDRLRPGIYSLIAASQGFDTLTTSVSVKASEATAVALDLKIAALTDSVDVVAPTAVVPSTGTLTASEGLTRRELDELASAGGLQSALRLLASVIEVPGGLAIKGGRPSQASVQLGPGAFVDPATGLSQVTLPDDAVDSVTVLPNPYAVEYGRFSSGLVLIQTRRASEVWKTRINKLDPSFRTKRGNPFAVIGIGSFSPRLETGGPLIKDKVFLQQAAQYRYRTSDVASRPQSEVRRSHRFSSFTRLDANMSPRHLLIGAVGLFPASAQNATLGTFTPPNATVDTRGLVGTGSITERSLWSESMFSETTAEVHSYKTTVMPQGPLAMHAFPETTLGNFFNRQYRAATTYQVIETVSGTTPAAGGGHHMYKAGIDVLHTRYHGTSESKTVYVRRTDGTLARRLDYGPVVTEQAIRSTDLAIFAQDRLQPTDRWYIEAGGRLDRDGVIGRFNITPRLGSAILLNRSGTAVIRSGYGLFFERTPSVAGVFDRYEAPLDSRYASDGVTMLGRPDLFSRVVPDNLRTSRSSTWDVTFDQRFNAVWAIHFGAIDRRGTHELLVEPETRPTGNSILALRSVGRSQYREGEVSVHYTGRPGLDLNVSYVYSQARADLNAFTYYFDNVLVPVVGENGYGPARSDAPHRLLARGRATPVRDWLFVGVLDWRTGLPYSVVDEWLDYVGPRNDRRFPTYLRVDLGVEHRFKIAKYRPWIGVRADNAFSKFLPADVQNNIASPAFGTFYNSEYRQFRIQIRFES